MGTAGFLYCGLFSSIILPPFAVTSAVTWCIKWICLNHRRARKAFTRKITELYENRQLFSVLLFIIAVPACIAWILHVYYGINGWIHWYMQSGHPFWELLRSRIPLVVSVFSLAAGCVKANRRIKARLLGTCWGFLLLAVFIIPMFWSLQPFLDTLLILIKKAPFICAMYTLCIVPPFFLPHLLTWGIDWLCARLKTKKEAKLNIM